MASKSQAGRGTLFAIGALTGAAGPETFAKVGEVMQCTIGGITVDLEDVSSFDSGFIKEKLGTMADAGTVELKYNYLAGGTDAGQVALNAALRTGLPYDFKITLPKNSRLSVPQTVAGDVFALSAIVSKGNAMEITTKGIVSGSATLTLTSDIVFTAGS